MKDVLFIVGRVLVLASIWLLTSAWPHWLVYPPSLLTICWILSSRLREDIRRSLRAEPSNDAERRLSFSFLGIFAFYGLVAGLSTMYLAGRTDLQWSFFPICSLALAFTLSEKTSTSRLPRALCKNLGELLIRASTVLGVYAVVIGILGMLDLDKINVGTLQYLEQLVGTVHEVSKRLKPTIFVLFALLAAVLVLRVAKAIWPTAFGWASRIPAIILVAAKWNSKVCAYIGLAASITFLATSPSGSNRKITLTLRKTQAEYTGLASRVQDRVERALREEIVLSAIRQRPERLRVAMNSFAAYDADRRLYAQRELQVRGFSSSNSDLRGQIDESNPEKETIHAESVRYEMDPNWIPASISTAAAEAARLSNNSSDNLSSTINDLSMKLAKKIELPKKLFLTAPSLAGFGKDFSIFGDLLSAISDSISETAFDALRKRITKGVLAEKKSSAQTSLETLISQRVTKELEPLNFNWHLFDGNWEKRENGTLRTAQEALRAADGKLLVDARAKRKEELNRILVQTHGNVQTLKALGRESNQPGLQTVSSHLSNCSMQLADLVLAWPLSGKPEKAMEDRLHRIQAEISKQHDGLAPQSLEAGVRTKSQYLEGEFELLGEPLRNMIALNSEAEHLAARALAFRPVGGKESARLTAAIGAKRYKKLVETLQSQWLDHSIRNSFEHPGAPSVRPRIPSIEASRPPIKVESRRRRGGRK